MAPTTRIMRFSFVFVAFENAVRVSADGRGPVREPKAPAHNPPRGPPEGRAVTLPPATPSSKGEVAHQAGHRLDTWFTHRTASSTPHARLARSPASRP